MSNEYEEQEGSEDELDKIFSEHDNRIKKTGYYRSVIAGLFNEEGDPIAAEVNLELARWAKGQALALWGKTQPEVREFTPAQIAVLKQLSALTDDELRALKTLVGQVTKTPQLKPIQQPQPVQPPQELPEKKFKAKVEAPPKPAKKKDKPLVQAPLPGYVPYDRNTASQVMETLAMQSHSMGKAKHEATLAQSNRAATPAGTFSITDEVASLLDE